MDYLEIFVWCYKKEGTVEYEVFDERADSQLFIGTKSECQKFIEQLRNA